MRPRLRSSGTTRRLAVSPVPRPRRRRGPPRSRSAAQQLLQPRPRVFCRSLRSTLVALLVGLAIAGPATASRPVRLDIPRLGLDVALTRDLAYGPKVYYRDRDTVAIAGHRTTHTHPFLYLPRLRRGDAIFLGAKKYLVRRSAVVRPWQIWVLRYRGLVLSACHPAGSSAYRYVVFAAPAR
jgi:hypothetical protein